ncbi:MAG: hypothetical protein COB02_15070 [Candidatus Cloacimonadota bacterium]|nr:MAG: hypothetical protein COB02_15070 [Candidatus Cloacimonadota bacterium]
MKSFFIIKTAETTMKIKNKIQLIFTLCLVYAFVRYSILGQIPLQKFPLFIMNKVWASTALFLFCFAFISPKKANKKVYGIICFCCSIIHIIFSQILLSPQNYNKFYFQDELTMSSQICLSFGLYAFICFIPSLFLNNNLSQNESFKTLCKKSSFVASFFLLIHSSIAFYPSWLKNDLWHGNLPPISLICFCILVIVVLIKLLQKNNPT